MRAASLLWSWSPIIVGIAIVLAAGLWFGGLLSSGGAEHHNAAPSAVSEAVPSQQQQQLPAFVAGASDRVQEAYAYAAAHGDMLVYIPCYCGCGDHSGHRWVRDCFVKQWAASGITWDQHGSQCDVCVSIALDAKSKLGEGQSLATVRKYIDAKYSKIGPGTNTPLPPGMEE